jgi:hypothetical protein
MSINSDNFNKWRVLIVVIDEILTNLLYCTIFLVFLYDNLSQLNVYIELIIHLMM